MLCMHGISPYRVYASYTLLKGTLLVYYGGSAGRSLSRDEGSVVSLFLNIHGFSRDIDDVLLKVRLDALSLD
jgi:hypothetical protein